MSKFANTTGCKFCLLFFCWKNAISYFLPCFHSLRNCFVYLRFKHKNPEDKAEVPGGFLSDCNSDSLKIEKAYGDVYLSKAQIFTQYQFERLGYYSVDPDSKSSEVIQTPYNKTPNSSAHF